MPTVVFAPGRQNDWTALRSDRSPDLTANGPNVSGQFAAGQIRRPRNRQTLHVPDQQLQTACVDHRFALQITLASQTILQMDQTALRINAFFGASENAVKTQVWIAISIYVLVAIIKKRLDLKPSLYTILQILSVTIFEKEPLLQTLTENEVIETNGQNGNQLELFN